MTADGTRGAGGPSSEAARDGRLKVSTEVASPARSRTRMLTVVDIRASMRTRTLISGNLGRPDPRRSQLESLARWRTSISREAVCSVCGAGQPPQSRLDLLRANGVEALTLDGGMRAWSLAWNNAEAGIAGCDARRSAAPARDACPTSSLRRPRLLSSTRQLIRTSITELLAVTAGGSWQLLTHTSTPTISRARGCSLSERAQSSGSCSRPTRFPFRPIADGDSVTFGSRRLWVFALTRGHTAESTTYLLNEAVAFTGDTLFIAGVGRPDLEGGDRKQAAMRARQLYESISRLLALPAGTLILPGHVSEPVPFDGRLLAARVGEIREAAPLTQLDRDAFVETAPGADPAQSTQSPSNRRAQRAWRVPRRSERAGGRSQPLRDRLSSGHIAIKTQQAINAGAAAKTGGSSPCWL